MTINECLIRIQQYPQKIALAGDLILKEHAPKGKTGGLRGSIVYSYSENKVEIEATAPYAYFVDQGRGMVFPKNKKALSNNDDFGPVAWAGRAPAKHFARSAAQELEGKLKSLF